MNWAFVDYENLGSLEDVSLMQYERLYVFCGPKNNKLKLGDLPAEGFCRIELIGLKTSGRNNLDFHLAFYLGRYHEAADPGVGFHVLSNDGGFDGIIEHLQKLGRSCERVGTRSTPKRAAAPKAAAPKQARQPRAEAKPVPAPQPVVQLGEQARQVVAQLKQLDEKKRPTKKAKLLNWLVSQLRGQPNSEAPDALLQQLEAAGKLSFAGTNVKYAL